MVAANHALFHENGLCTSSVLLGRNVGFVLALLMKQKKLYNNTNVYLEGITSMADGKKFLFEVCS